ncbi:MAG TPA: hypothetical protein VNA69_20425 [Thermoanaerobaculia bacterium]|nr:hypothetical protein [Thermoanaerobaculia bacterium]
MISIVAVLTTAMLGCGGEYTQSGSPIALLVTSVPLMSQIDLAGGAGCDGFAAEVKVQAVAKNASAGGTFNQVRLSSYRVSYIRTDGGSQVPASFVRTLDTIIASGGSASLPEFVILEGDAVGQAPFAALQPQNGGRDPVTGRPLVKMDVIVEVFGETLGGDRVYDATRFPLDFCFNCGGCD